MKIITDTASLIAPADGVAQGVTVIPVCVSINDQIYQDYVQITGGEFLNYIAQGGVPTSSQPAIGDMLAVMEADREELLFLTIGDGLSGAYQTAMSARNMAQNPERIHVVNSQTLAGPLRYLVKKAVALKEQGWNMAQIKAALDESIATSISFVIPEDFDFLKRSGRLTAFTAKLGGALKLLPILTQTKDKTRITPISIKRSWRSAVETILQKLHSAGVDAHYLITVSHAGTSQKAEDIRRQVQERFPDSETELLELSPALMTHGGPGCIVIQAIGK